MTEKEEEEQSKKTSLCLKNLPKPYVVIYDPEGNPKYLDGSKYA